MDTGSGMDVNNSVRDPWIEGTKSNYQGDEEGRRARMATVSLRDRDGLRGRLFDVTCPVMWLHGTSDIIYSVANAEEEIKLFVQSPEAEVVTVKDGQPLLSASYPKEVENALVDFVGRWHDVS